MEEVIKEFDLKKVLRVAQKLNENIEDQREVVEIVNILKDSKSLANALDSTNESLKREIVKNKGYLAEIEKTVKDMELEASDKAGTVAAEIQMLDIKLEDTKRDNRLKINTENKTCADEVSAKHLWRDQAVKTAEDTVKKANTEALDAVSKKQRAEHDFNELKEKTLSMTLS